MTELLTVSDVAELLAVHEETVRRWVWAHDLPHRRLGPSQRTIRFTQADIDEYLEGQRRG